MPSVPMGTASYERQKTGYPETILRNMFLEKDETDSSIDGVLRVQRGGLRKLLTFPAAIRGLFQMDGVFGGVGFVAAGDKLYTTDFGSFTEIATIPDDGQTVSLAASFEKLGIVSSGEFHIWDGEELVEVVLPDGKAPISLDVMNSYFILPLSDGTFYWQTPGITGFDGDNILEALNFATAESIPDGLLTGKRLRDDLFLFGPESIEVWQATGDAEATFTRATGRLIDRGCHSRETVVTFDNSVVFVGNDGLVYRLQDVPERISTFGIEERIRNRNDLCSAFQFTSDGHKFYCLRIPSQGTFAYDAATQVWSEFSTIGEAVWDAYLGGDITIGPICADEAGNLYKVDPDYALDNDQPIEKTVSGTVALSSKRYPNSSLAIEIGCDQPTTISLRWKDALSDWSQPKLLSARAGSDIINAWRLGATRGAWRTFEISSSDETIIRISGATANESRAV